jgi:hypothetical protein
MYVGIIAVCTPVLKSFLGAFLHKVRVSVSSTWSRTKTSHQVNSVYLKEEKDPFSKGDLDKRTDDIGIFDGSDKYATSRHIVHLDMQKNVEGNQIIKDTTVYLTSDAV